jgi:signal transduction histidine kinase
VIDADRLENLVQNVLLSANIDNKKFELFYEEFDLLALINDIKSKLTSADTKTTIHINSTADQLYINADRSGITLIISNLIENGLKYTPGQKELNIDVTAVKSVNHIIVEIKDQGIGISDIYKKEIFKRFYRVTDANTRSQKGTGLGLFIAQQIAVAHNGSIAVTDNKPKGSIFTLTLPIYAQ